MTEHADRNGGPAFPRPYGTDEHETVCNANFAQEGMSLRDWFAGQILPAIMQSIEAAPQSQLKDFKATGMEPRDLAAEMSYIQADAMLKAREASQ